MASHHAGNRDSFASSFGVLMALVGSAIGLGNLWRFPYLAGVNGGAAFIIIYIAFVFMICLPIMLAEFVVGRRSHANTYGAFSVLAPGSKWPVIGIITVATASIILAFYSVVGGWTADYLVMALTFNLPDCNATSHFFREVTASPLRPQLFTMLFLVLTAGILMTGIKNGIEKYSKILMPLLFVVVIIIAVRSVTLSGASEGLKFLFKPDFSKVTGTTVLEALGQAFFSSSIGIGTILTYASYVNKQENMVATSFLTSLSNVVFALIAGVAIMPAVFAFGLSPEEGPGLAFTTLPQVFAQLPGGALIAILFFFMMLVAALTSSISLLEVPVTYLVEEFKLPRKVAVAVAFVVCLVMAMLCSLYEVVFNLCDSLTANYLMPVSALLLVIFVGWRMKKVDIEDELSNSYTLPYPRWLYDTVYYLLRYLAPVVIVIVLLYGLIS